MAGTWESQDQSTLKESDHVAMVPLFQEGLSANVNWPEGSEGSN